MEYKGHSMVCGVILQQMEISLPWLRISVPLRLCVEFLLHGYG